MISRGDYRGQVTKVLVRRDFREVSLNPAAVLVFLGALPTFRGRMGGWGQATGWHKASGGGKKKPVELSVISRCRTDMFEIWQCETATLSKMGVRSRWWRGCRGVILHLDWFPLRHLLESGITKHKRIKTNNIKTSRSCRWAEWILHSLGKLKRPHQRHQRVGGLEPQQMVWMNHLASDVASVSPVPVCSKIICPSAVCLPVLTRALVERETWPGAQACIWIQT